MCISDVTSYNHKAWKAYPHCVYSVTEHIAFSVHVTLFRYAVQLQFAGLPGDGLAPTCNDALLDADATAAIYIKAPVHDLENCNAHAKGLYSFTCYHE